PIHINHGWSLVHLRSYQDITAGIGQLRTLSLKIGICCFLFSILIVFLFSKALTRPIYALIEKIKLIGADNLDVEFDEFSDNEIGSINRQMNKITRKLKQNIADMKQNQEKMLKSECKALQSQINPHFLYNTLDAINWMAIRIGADNISTMSMQLGTFFRHSLNKGNLTTTIQAELEHLSAYTGIQAYRYDHRFTYQVSVEPEILNCTIVNLVLQPLVENSLLHGAANTNGACNIRVIGKTEGDDILIDVIDDGCGCNAKLMNRCLQKDISMSHGYGVINVHQRLRIYFGDSYGLCYLPATLGTHVRVRIPRRYASEQKEIQNA
ncbi:MAG: histidine kinase, partial [Ruthenibacterium sp.]